MFAQASQSRTTEALPRLYAIIKDRDCVRPPSEAIWIKRPMTASPPPRATAVSVGAKLLLMSLASGCMDILSYRLLGQVFTSAMTGNAALLGLDLGQGNIPATSRNMAAFAGFLVGLSFGAALLRGHQGTSGRSRAMTRTFLIEEMLLVTFAVLWHLGAGPSSDGLLYGLIALSAVAMGVQSAVAHHIGVPGITTTYFTGTLTNIVVGAVGRRLPPTAAKQPSGRVRWPALAFLAYIMGAALTGSLLLHPVAMLAFAPAIDLPALPAVVIAIVLLIALVEETSDATKRLARDR